MRPKPSTRPSTLPEGTISIGAGLVINGLGSYAFLVIAARALGPDGYAALSVLWALVFLVGPGFFFPIEQELGRAIAHRRSQGQGIRPLVMRASSAGLAICVVLAAIGLTVGRPLFDALFDENLGLVLAFIASLFSYFALHLVRGFSSGTGRFGHYGLAMGMEALLRLGAAVVLVMMRVDDPASYGYALAISPLVAALIAARGGSRSMGAGPRAPLGELSRALLWLFMGSFLAQFLVNAGPLALKLVAPDDMGPEVGRFLSGLIIARIPLFLFMAFQAALLPKLTRLIALGRTAEFVGGVKKTIAVVTGLGIAATASAYVAGPSIVGLLFGAEQRLPAKDLAYLAAGTGSYMLAMAIAQALIATSGHLRAALGWLAGVIAFLVVVVTGEGLLARVEWSYLLGSAVAAVAMLMLLASSIRAKDPHAEPEAAMQVPLEP